jgi:hypothetical protein
MRHVRNNALLRSRLVTKPIQLATLSPQLSCESAITKSRKCQTLFPILAQFLRITTLISAEVIVRRPQSVRCLGDKQFSTETPRASRQGGGSSLRSASASRDGTWWEWQSQLQNPFRGLRNLCDSQTKFSPHSSGSPRIGPTGPTLRFNSTVPGRLGRGDVPI